MKKHYLEIIKATNKYIAERATPVRDENNRYFNACLDPYGLADNGNTIGTVAYYALIYSCAELDSYRDENYLTDIINMCGYLMTSIHKDGTTDQVISNFRTPGTFELCSITRSYFVFEKAITGTDLEIKALSAMKEVINRLASGMMASGFHTPNHRWMETASLFSCYNITGRKELLEKADKYLAEGIDIDENGEYTERSSGMYNKVNDMALYIIASQGNKPEMLEHVYKNLHLMLLYLEHDGTVFTQNSRRKDKGEVSTSSKWYPDVYYWLFLYIGYIKNDKLLLKTAEKIFDDTLYGGRGIPDSFLLYMEHPELKTWEPEPNDTIIPGKFEFYHPKSNIFRVRRDKWSYSLLGNNNPNFLFFHCGNTQGYMRICASFFAVAQFCAEKIEKTNDSYVMRFHAHGEYRLPYEIPPKTSVWAELDYSARGVVMPVELYIDVTLTPKEDGFDLNVKTSGCDKVPIKIETVVSDGTRIITDNTVQTAKAGNDMIVKSGTIELDDVRGNVITVDGAFASHLYANGMRGSLSQSGDAFSIYFTSTTPIDKTLNVRFSRRVDTFSM